MEVLAVVCITLSALLAASALSIIHPSAAFYLYLLSPDVCITLSGSLPASARLTTPRTLRYRHFQTSSQRPYPPIHLEPCILTLLCTLMHSCVRLLSFSSLAIDRLSHLSSFQSCEVSFAVNRSVQHFLFRLDFPLLLPLPLCRGC